MYLEIFLADFAVFRVFLGISRDFAEIPEFRGSATVRNIRSPAFEFEVVAMTNGCYLQMINSSVKSTAVWLKW